MASSALKGTRKTYSFEEREILITLINKYDDVEDKKSDPISMCKRKSAWSQLADEYNSMVGPQAARSAVQLRRCWENMKACKKNREERKSRGYIKGFGPLSKERKKGSEQCCEGGMSGRNATESSSSCTGNIGLPPNIVFEPNDSEPFTLQSVCTLQPPKFALKKDMDSTCGSYKEVRSIPEPAQGSMADCLVSSETNDLDSPILDHMDDEEPVSDGNRRSNFDQVTSEQTCFKRRKSTEREEELHVLALSEAQMKVDIAAMLKEEARIKLQEAQYREEEARLRMLFFTYKLDRMKEG